MPLVEVVPSILTSPETVAATLALAGERLDRVIVRTTDRAGFIVNTLLMPYLMSAIRMLEAGYATAEDIDTSMVTGCAHPMGPLALADFIGLDTCAAIADSMYGEFKEPTFTPPPLLRRMVESGLLGRKSGRGFYTY
jgi:3-hydroxybutyryl-CoA dehydrogenase